MSSNKTVKARDVVTTTTTHKETENLEVEESKHPTVSATTPNASDEILVDKELEDKLTELDKTSPGDSEIKRKSATLTPSTSSESQACGNSQGSGIKGLSNPHGLSTITRNNLRRSFTLPRGLLARKSGQTGPVSENQNGSFMKNIFLTLVRTKSVRKPKGDSKESKEENGVTNNTDQTKLTNGLLPGYTPAAVGLKNQGNTCFMNAIVQCLSHTDCLARYLVTDGYKSDLRRKHWIKNGKCEVTEELAVLLKNAWLRQNPTVLEDAVTKFKAAIEKRASQWRGSEQHDAQEFFLWLLDRLHEDLNQAASSKYKPMKNNFGRSDEQVAAEALANHLRCNNSIIQEIFGAHFRSSLTCPGCGRQSATFDPFVCVSLPIPQAKQEVPVYVNIVYLAQQPRQVKLGLSIISSADIKELKQVLAADTGIEENNILLAEIDGEGFHRTFTETQLVSSLSNNDALYCIETPQLRETNENDGAFLMLTWTNILVTNNGNTRVRFGSPYVTQIARETGFIDIQKVFLKEMAAILQTDVLVSEQKDPVFSIKILDGSSDIGGSQVDPLVEHPLYMESVDHALSLCDEDVPPHIKVHLEWTPESKDKIIINDSESVEEHASVAQTRLRHAEETVGSVTLGECFDLYTTAEQLSAEDSWHCPHCNRKEQGTLKMIGLWTAPQVLVVHLKRFRQAAKARTAATKISSVVDFPVDGLDLGPHVMRRNRAADNNTVNSGINQASSPVNGCFGISNWKHRASFKKQISSAVTNNRLNSTNGFGPSPDEIVYDLYAVCNHHGKDVLGGHYTAYCKNPVDGTWWSFDDTRVSKLSSPSDVKTSSAYILFYHQRGYPCNQQSSHHWCRNLLKKHKLTVGKDLNGIDTSKSSSIEDVKSNSTNGHPESPNSPTSDASESDKDQNASYQSETDPRSSDEEPALESAEANFTAPLARMEDVSMGLSPYIKEVQIESTV